MDLSRRHKGTWVPLVLVVLAVVAVLDQISKIVMLRVLEPKVPVPILGDWLCLYLSFNSGASFSMGTNLTWLFTCIAIGFIGAAVFYAPRIKSGVFAVGVALIAGGATGNLIDRLCRPPQFFLGHVVDFISVKGFAVFNIADSAITIGAGIVMAGMFLEEQAERRAQAESQSQETTDHEQSQGGDCDERQS